MYDYKPQIIQSLKVLTKSDIIDYNLLNEINELRMYRNALVHGIDFTIAQEVCDYILKIYEILKSAFEIYQEKEEIQKNGKMRNKKYMNYQNKRQYFKLMDSKWM